MQKTQEIEKVIEECIELIKKGYKKKFVLSKIPSEYDREELLELAICRIKIGNKFSRKNLFFDRYGLRYSTPEVVGMYRASKITNMRVADVSCGCGMQAIFLGMTNESVLGIDINPKRIEYAIMNAIAYGVKNVEFRVMNALSYEAVNIAKKYDLIFSDPSRKAEEKERSLETLMPPPLKVIEKHGNKNYMFDLPPQISKSKIPNNWNLEYISINHKINRLSAYVSEDSDGRIAATTLPTKASLESSRFEDIDFSVENIIGTFLYEVDESIYYAGLLGKLLDHVKDIWYISTGKRRTLASSEKLIENPFLRPYRVIGFTTSLRELVNILNERNVGKVTLRISISPSKYWLFRNSIEKKLKGSKKIHLFRVGELYVACEHITL